MNRNTLQWKPRDWLSLDFNKYVHHEPTNKNLLVELFTFLNQFIIWCAWWFIYTMSHLFQYADYRILYHCVTSLEKIHFLSTFSESHQILVTRVLIFRSSPHCARKCMAKLYAVCIAGASQRLRKKIGLWTVKSFPIQSFKLIHFVSSGTMLALLWSFQFLW